MALALGTTVMNFGTRARVVGYFHSADGLPVNVTGWPLLRALDRNDNLVGDRWLADPALCLPAGSDVVVCKNTTFARITDADAVAVAAKVVAPKRKRVTVALKCNECEKKFRVSPNATDPECPKCGGVDWDVLETWATISPRLR